MITLTLPDHATHNYPTLRAAAFALVDAGEYEVYSIDFRRDGKRVSWVVVWREIERIKELCQQ